MRIHLSISKSTSGLLPFDYQRFLVGAFHKWVGENVIHNDVSLYSLSWLIGGKATKNGLHFSDGASWFISSVDEEMIRKLLKGIINDPDFAFGMQVAEVNLQETPEFGEERRFLVNSPILVKKQLDGQQKHLSYEDSESDSVMTAVLQSKLQKFGIESQGVEVQFDRTYGGARQKLVTYRGIGNRANVCPIIVRGTPEQVAFAWNVGIGHSTGIGFGALI
ncbi:CRISPR-associated endoribonuclease Cas6 [Telluribacter sp.]|jgi:CRISPR-associated endoribonuclease Cas6|uniref:CRISPR-associated endoribonuclease Cas6 n=1 Tax=Telluribacter sp. TaxID=1978767 RepID=UPI002E11EC4F|nr:CRISPR-associated endoribonuclease Cas6 [Telluribacter sp.]